MTKHFTLGRTLLCWALAVGSLWLIPQGIAMASPEIPGPPQSEPIALVGGTVHLAGDTTIEKGTVVFDQGKITAVGAEVKLDPSIRQIDVTGKHVYPGLIDPFTNLGLVEINSVRATVDTTETGTVNPNVRAQAAVNPDSELIPVTRSNGVLSVLTAPLGGLISGRSAVIMLDGWTWEDMTLRGDVGMHVVWPRMAPTQTWWAEDSGSDQLASRDRALENLQRAVDDARAYWTLKKARKAERQPPGDIDLRWEAMIPVLEGKMPLFVTADEIQQIQSAVAFCLREKLKLVIVGGYDAPLCADLLKQHQVPVIVKGVNRLPRRRTDAYDTPFTVPARLHEAGVTFCIADGEKMSNQRNLPYDAAKAVAYGLPAEEGLKAITIYAAKILGVDDRIGSLEAGKDATLFVADGDILEIPTLVEAAYIQGRLVDLSDRHKRLYNKYQEKYRRQ